MRALELLIDANVPGWELVEERLNKLRTSEILPRDKSMAQSELLGPRVTTRSPMGALVYGCGSVVIEGSWLRVLGSGCERIKRGIYGFNLYKSFSEAEQIPRCLLVADDVLGGFFAINGGAFRGKAGNVFYCAPDSSKLEDTQLSYSRFFTGRFAVIYLNFTSFTAGAVGGEDMRKISLDKANFVRYGGMPA